jgi:hypothetical protein
MQFCSTTGCPLKLCCAHRGQYYTFIACWWGKYENLFTQEYHISRGQRPRGIWYSWVNTFSNYLNPHAMNVLLYRMKPRKHIHVKYCWQTYFKFIGTLSQTFSEASKGDGIWFLFHGIWFLSCVITCCDFYPLSYLK